MGVRHIVSAGVGGEVIIGVEKIVAPAAVEVIFAGPAHQPIISEIAEDGIVAVTVDVLVREGTDGTGALLDPFRFIEVEQEAIDPEEAFRAVLDVFLEGRLRRVISMPSDPERAYRYS